MIPAHAQSLFDPSTISQDFIVEYVNDLVEKITQDSSIYDIIGFSIGMVIYGIFIYHFYRFLSRKDLFSLKLEQRLRGGKLSASGEKISAAPRVVAYIATNAFIFPIIIFAWFLAYSLFMFLLAQDMSVKTVFLVSSSLVIAIRIAAYYSEDLAKDLAKLLPFALLGFFLLSPTFFGIDEIKDRILQIPNFITQIAAFLLVAITVEITLSILYLIKLKFIKPRAKKNNTSDSEAAV